MRTFPLNRRAFLVLVSACALLISGLWGAGARLAAAQATAQALSPDYAVRNIRPGTPANRDEYVVEFEVVNSGIPASQSANAVVRVAGAMDVLATQPIAALGAGDQVSSALRFPVAALRGVRDDASMQVTVGLPEIEPDNSNTRSNNFAFIQVAEVRAAWRAAFPGETPADVEQTGETGTGENGGEAGGNVPDGTGALPTLCPDGVNVFGQCVPLPAVLQGLGFANPLTIAGIALLCGVLLVVLWIVSAILRLIFTRPPQFPAWQPPYAQNMYLNPNTPQARRAQWQLFAQSDTLPYPDAGVEFSARKLLAGVGTAKGPGEKLQGWHIEGLRLVQYDMYGRIARTNTIAATRSARQLDKAARLAWRNPRRPLTHRAALRRVRPAARRIIKEFYPKIRRTPSLPIAADVRFRADRGRVRILFELYQSTGRAWQLLDTWEPELALAAGSLAENFTYTLFGQKVNEKPRAFRRRLEEELAVLLATMIETPAERVVSRERRRRTKAADVGSGMPEVVVPGAVVITDDGVSPATASMPAINIPASAEPLSDTAKMRVPVAEGAPPPAG